MDSLEVVFFALITSATTVGVLVFVLKHYLKSAIDMRFRRLQREEELQFSLEEKLGGSLIEKRFGIYPEIVEVIYRLRKIFEEGMEKEAAYLWDPDLAPLCHHLTENLFRWRIFLADATFESLHEYKHICQDVLMFVDIHTRKESIRDQAAYRDKLPEIGQKVERAQVLYDQIRNALTFDRPKG